MRNYLKMDFYRMMTSNSLKIAIGGVLSVYLVGSIQVKGSGDVCQIIYNLKLYSILILSFAFSAFAYANAFVEDAEQKFWYLAIQRGNRNTYIWSKILICFLGAVLAMAAGTMFFTFLAGFQMPLLDESNILIRNNNDCFQFLITENHILLYIFFTSIRLGIFCGILSVFSMWLSLYVRNRMFAVCIPVVGFYFWGNYFYRIFGEIDYLNFNAIYLGSGNFFSNPVLNFLYALGVACFFVIIIGFLIQSKVKKEIWGESK